MAAAPVKSKSPLHDFPLTFLKWNTKKDRRQTPPPPPPPPSLPPRSSRTRKPVKPEPKPEPEPAPEEVEKQWNLRPRRKVISSSSSAAVGGGEVATTVVDAAANENEKKRFWISLSKDEIEEDILLMTGGKPSRRPRKHPKIVQRYLDNVFPGLWLVGLTPDSYRTSDPPLPKK